jgi:hypothetical protein
MFIPNAIVAGIASLTDASIHYSISSASFRDISSKDSMVYVGWSIARDVANLGFIFALFVIAFSLILNRSILKFDPKKAIVKVIVMALLINFSMLFCKLIIQTGDLFANVLYTRIDPPGESTVTVNGLENGPTDTVHDLGVRGVTLGIVNNINPQKLMQSTGADYNIQTVKNLTFGLVKIKGWAYYVQMGTLAFYCMLVNYTLLYFTTSICFIYHSIAGGQSLFWF